jgi:hypothetical protein
MIEERSQALANAAAKEAHRRIQPKPDPPSCNESRNSESPQDITSQSIHIIFRDIRPRRHGRGVHDLDSIPLLTHHLLEDNFYLQSQSKTSLLIIPPSFDCMYQKRSRVTRSKPS